MKKIFMAVLLCVFTVATYAVPARRGWQTRTQADGSTIEIQQVGDEFYHFMINRDGKEVREVHGMYVEVGEAPSAEVAKARRAKGVARRQRKDVGVTPNLAPKGVVILVNFSDKSMQSGHTQATFDELCNSTNCTVNSGYPSAAQYFADQSNGTYRPQFDVFGPVTLSRNVAYYGTDKPGQKEGDDQYATDAVVEGCILANQQFSINWADYDSDNDGYVDFVYVIYAGKGQADGGTSETIWPHNWSVEAAIYYGNCTYPKAQCKVGGKKLDNYAMSGELSGNSLGGIGTLCHEFGHVMGLPDLYDTDYGTVYDNCLTPNDWDIMDGGSYNGDGHCPPNYDPWEKDFFGWLTPINLGNEGQNVTLYANGTENQQTYQINASGTYISPTTSGLRYYIENRQAVGWDAPLTGHGMLIWKVNFNASAWENNAPNNSETSGAPLYTVVSATGTKIGWDGSTDNCPKNTFPGSGRKTSYTGISNKPLLNIAESNQVVTLTYIAPPAVEPFTITWMANGSEFDTTQSTGTVVLPEVEPEACSENKVFVGWCTESFYSSQSEAPAFVKAGDAVAEGAVFYAVYATPTGEGSAMVESTIVFANEGYENAQNVTEVEMDNCNLTFAKGTNTQNAPKYYTTGSAVRCYKNNTLTVASENAISEIVFATVSGYSGVVVASEGNYNSGTWTGNTNEVIFTNAPTDNAQWRITSMKVTTGGGASYSNYSTSCGPGTDVEWVTTAPKAQKIIENGQVLILRDGIKYTVLGQPVQ